MKRLLPIAAILLLGVPAGAQDGTKTTTSLRLDAVDPSGAKQGTFRLFATVLDQFRKPIRVPDPKAWEVFFDGEPKRETGELKVELLSKSEQGVSVVAVIAAYGPFDGDAPAFSQARQGASDLLNALRPADRSAVVTFGNRIFASGDLNPSHEQSVQWLTTQNPAGLVARLFDAIDRALNTFPPTFDGVGPNRAIILVSDGFSKLEEFPRKRADKLKTIVRLAKERSVRICAIGFSIDDPSKLQTLRQLANQTGGSYRNADTAEEIANQLDSFRAELLNQHVLTLQTTDFEGNKEVSFKIRATHGGRDYDSPSAQFVRVPEQESHLLTWLLAGAGGILGLVLLVMVGRKTIELIAAGRGPAETVVTGPATRACHGCAKQIPVDWLACKFCEQLPHKGRLVFRSAGPLNGTTWFIKEALTNIGSADSNHVVLTAPSVSKRHAGIKVQDNRFELADFGSTNGVLVNGQRIQKQFLKDGDVLSIGVVELEFSLK